MAYKQIAVYNGGKLKAYLKKEDCLSSSIENRQNDESVLTLSMDNKHSKYNYVLEQSAVFRCDGKEYIHTLTDDGIKITHNSDGSTTSTFTLVESYYALNKVYVTAYNSTTGYSSIDTHMVVILSGGTSPLTVNGEQITTTYEKGSAGYVLTAILYGSGWRVGIVDVTGIQDLETDKKSIIENVKEILSKWGGILVFDSVNKTISLRDEATYLPYHKFRVRTGINAKVIEKSVSSDIITKAFIYGKDNLNIKSVNNGLEYITNHTYIDTVYEDNLINNNISEATKLLEWGIKELEKKCRRRSTITAQFIDTSCFDGGSTFATNDIIDVYDSEIDVNYQARVIYKKYDFFAPYNCTAEIGDNLKNYDDMLNNVFRTTKVVNNMIATNNTISATSVLMPDKSNITKIIVDQQSAINQNAGEIAILQQNQITEEQVDNIITSSITAGDGAINMFVKQETELNSRTYVELPQTYKKNDIWIPDKDYVTPTKTFKKGTNYIAINSSDTPTQKLLRFSDGNVLQFSDSKCLVFPEIIADNWDKKDNYVIDKEVISSINLSADTAKIKAEKIKLEGIVTANENFKIDIDGNMYANNGIFLGEVKDDNGNIYFGKSQGLLSTFVFSNSKFDVIGYYNGGLGAVTNTIHLIYHIPDNFVITNAYINLLVSAWYYIDTYTSTSGWGYAKNLKIHNCNSINGVNVRVIGMEYTGNQFNVNNITNTNDITNYAYNVSSITPNNPSSSDNATTPFRSKNIKDYLNSSNGMLICQPSSVPSSATDLQAVQNSCVATMSLVITGYQKIGG